MRDIRTTSLIPYFRTVLPTLGERHKEVLLALNTGDFTNNELASYLGWQINRVTPRIKELREKGMVEEKGRRPCKNTGEIAFVWGLRTEGEVEFF